MAQVASYLLQFQGTEPADPKAPEGEIWGDPDAPEEESISEQAKDSTASVNPN